MLVEVDVSLSVAVLVAEVPDAEPEPEAEPEIEPEALTLALLLVSAGAVVEEDDVDCCEAVASLVVLLLELELVPAGVVSMPEVLVFVSTEQPVRAAITPRTLTNLRYLFFILLPSEV